MHMKSVLFLVVIGACAVLARKDSSSEEDRSVPLQSSPNAGSQAMFVNKRYPNRYPRGRPFQQQQMDGRYPQMGSYQSGMSGPRPFGQNSYPFMGGQQYPSSFGGSSSYPSLSTSGSSRPFYAGSGRPGKFENGPQMSAGGQFPGGPQMSAGGQFPGGPQMSAGGQFPGGPQVSAGGRFPSSGQQSFGAQFPGSTFPMTS